MSINYDVYGQPSSWAYFTENINQLKVVNFGNGYNLATGILNHKLSYDEPIDPTIAFCGIGGECPLSNLVYYHGDGTSIFHEVKAKDSTGYFINTIPSVYENYWDLSSAFTMYESSSTFDLGVWAKGGDSQRNANNWVQPVADFKPQNIVLCIYVDCKSTQDGAVSTSTLKDYLDNGGYTTAPYVERVRAYPLIGNYVEGQTIRRTTSLLAGDFLISPSTLEPFESSHIEKCYRYNSLNTKIDTSFPLLFSTLNTNMPLNDFIVFGDFSNDPNFSITQSENKYWRTSYHVTSQNKEAFKEMCLRACAQYGLYFTPDERTAQSGSFTDENMYIGIIDKNGITHGDYLKGERTVEAAQAQWDSIRESPYDPDKVVPPAPDKNPVIPSTPGFTLAIDNGSVCYALTQDDWRLLWDDIYGGGTDWKSLIDGLALYGANPLNAILNYRWYPFLLNATVQEYVRLGSTVIQPHQFHKVTDPNEAFISSTASFYWGRDKNFINIRKSKARIWLPFYGFYELPMTQLIDRELTIQFQYNLPDDNGVWFIMFGGSIYDYVECQPYIEIPITGDNSLQIAAAKAQRNLSIATTVIGAGIGIAAGLTVAAPAIGNIVAAGVEGAWGFGGGLTGGIAAAAANIGPLAGEGLLAGLGAGLGSATTALAQGGIKTANTVMQSALQIGSLSTNVPVHSTGSDTTFLHLPFSPYIEIFTNRTMDTYDETQYKLKVGISCDVWETLNKMPENSFLKTTGVADMSSSGMELGEIEELNSILQNGFFK